MKECGDCTWCCYFCSVPELGKPIRKWCEYCIEERCSIYDKRPKSCVSFKCLWLTQTQLPEYLRPDRCNMMFELPKGCRVYIGYINPDTPEAWREEDIVVLVDKINKAGHSVVMLTHEGKMFSIGDGCTREEMHKDLNRLVASLKKGARFSGKAGLCS